MSDTFYRLVRMVGRPVFWMSSRPIVIGVEHVPLRGPCIIAATHQSPYDIPLLMRHTPRMLDFVSIVEVFRNPLVAWFYGSLNAFPLDRSRADAKTVMIIIDRLERSRVVAMFPEGGFRKGAESVVHSRRIRPGIGRIASLAQAPIVPCVLMNSGVYSHFASWLPLGLARYGVIYGEPIDPGLEPEAIELALVDRFVALHGTLSRVMEKSREGRAGSGSA
jgi:1-acyl-sn-glycerol-3-phosphate acyltransferase